MTKWVLLTTVFLATLSGAVLAQAPRGPGGTLDPLAGLKNALNLTDAQVTTITALLQAEQPRLQAIHTEIEAKRQAVDGLLSVDSPVAVDVGNAVIALHISEAKIKAEADSLLSQIKQQLTSDQQEKLDTLLAANGGRGLPIPGLGIGPGPR